MTTPDTGKKDTVKLGNYILLETIGIGSFGKVKLAQHVTTGQKVAMKIMNKKKMTNMELGVRVKREIQYLKLLRHPHIIKLYEVLTTPTEIVMVMEYAGGELFNYIVEKGKMTEDEARQFFQQIISAIEYCHRHNITHRDLKPENLLLDDQNHVKIADFGLSNLMTDGDFLKTSCGSPNYAAPEVISGKLYSGREVDIWVCLKSCRLTLPKSCGVILYAMICGRLPFDDEYIPSLFRKINEGIYTIPEFVSADARDLITKMLNVDPVARISIGDIRKHPFFSKNLPDYLLPLPDVSKLDVELIDMTIVKKLKEKLRVSQERILTALRLDEEHNELTKEQRSIRVAYQLMMDQILFQNTKLLSRVLKQDSSIGSMQITSPPPPSDESHDLLSRSPSIASASLSRRKYSGVPHDGGAGTPSVVSSNFTEDDYDFNYSISLMSGSLPRSSFNYKPSRLNPHHSQVLLEENAPMVISSGVYKSTPQTTDSSPSTSQLQQQEQQGTSSALGNESLAPTIAEPTFPQAASTTTSSSIPKNQTLMKWHLGIRSKSSAREILLELYQALKKTGFQWKQPIVDPEKLLLMQKKELPVGAGGRIDESALSVDTFQHLYRIPCRYNYSSHEEAGELLFDLNVYKIEGEQKANDGNDPKQQLQLQKKKRGFLVDFKFVEWRPNAARTSYSSGAVIFMECCSKIIIELAIH